MLAAAIDAFACEAQFIDHLAPVWNALPPGLRGVFWTEQGLQERAARYGIEARTVIRVNYAKVVNERPALVASLGDTKTGRLRGYSRFLFIEHGAGQSYLPPNGVHARHGSYAGGVDRDDTTLFMVPNAYAADLWRGTYPNADVQIVGCPKLDTLPRKDHDEPPTVAISFHWPGKQAPETDSAFGEYHMMLPALRDEFNLIGHCHPKGEWPKMMRSVYQRNGIEFVPDFDEVCRRADVYVCDNSSTLFEFAATGRPVVVLNSKLYRRDVHHGLRFWEAATVGEQVDAPGALVAAVRRALHHPQASRKDREAALALVYQPSTGGAERAAEAIIRHLAA